MAPSRIGISAAFLDRDGTINRKAPAGDYIKSPAELELLPRAAAGVRRLNERGVKVIVVTNQRSIARRLMTDRDLAAVHDHLQAELARQGARIDAILYCPHDNGVCDCRKPGVGMFLAARAADPSLDFARAAVVGDSDTDVAAGRALAMTTVLLSGSEVSASPAWAEAAATVDHVAASLWEAANWLLDRPARGSGIIG